MTNALQSIPAGQPVPANPQSLQDLKSSNCWSVLEATNDPSEAMPFLSPVLRASLPAAAAASRAELEPIDNRTLVMGLTRALSLVAGALDQQARKEWIMAAATELQHAPGDLVEAALGRARMYCDHVSKIVPFVLKDIEDIWAERRRVSGRIARLQKLAEQGAKPTERCTPEQAAAIREEYGIPAEPAGNFPPNKDGWKARKLNLRMPTVQDYIELGLTREAAEEAVASQAKLANAA